MSGATAPLKRIATLSTARAATGERPTYTLDVIEGGMGVLADAAAVVSAPPSENGVADVHPGDVLFGKLRPYLAKVLLVDRLGYASTELLCLRPGPDTEPRWLRYVMLSRPAIDWAIASSDGTKMPRTSWDRLGDFRIWFPNIESQRAIADFLDAETARIHALIAKKRSLEEHLRDRERAMAERHLLGLDLPSSDAGSRFLESVPVDWRETTLRHLRCNAQTGPFGSQLHASDYVGGGWPVVNPANLVNGSIQPAWDMTVSDAKRAELSRHVLRPGDVVFGRRGEMGRAALVTEEHDGWLCGTGSLRLRTDDPRLEPMYLARLLQTRALRNYFSLNSIGSTMENLNSDIVLGAPVRLPPIALQRAIVHTLVENEVESAQLVSRLERQIELLQEHRQALITAAVTGELDIAGVAA